FISRRMALAGGGAVLAAAGAGIAWQAGWFGSGSRANSIAVMPFANLSGDPGKAYFSDGVAAEVRTQLSRNPRLAVVAQTSSQLLRGDDFDAKAIARKLGVSYLLDGNVRAAGSQFRIAAELIDGETGFSLWSQQFDRPAADVFAVQDEIAGAVTSALDSRLFGGPAPIGLRAGGGTDNVAAHDAFFKGSYLYGLARDEASDRAALQAFDAAIASDPAYGLAHASRSLVLTVIGNLYLKAQSRRDSFAAAMQAAQSAVSLSPSCAEAHSALGFAIMNGQLNVRMARAAYEKSAELGQGDANVLARYAIFQARAGRFDAARGAASRAGQLDPLNARTAWLKGEIALGARRYADAIPPVQQALSINPDISVARFVLGTAKLFLGDLPGAQAAYVAEPSSLFHLTGMAIINQRQGKDAAARAALQKLVAEHGDNGLYQQAQVAASWGQPDLALALLEKGYAAGDAGMMYALGDPFLDTLRKLPPFEKLLLRLGFDAVSTPEERT
ncbi:hypothetical protein, partial [Sandarakinorhabdus sp.]|uniref:hypothetical protein n=1 Tax=Sandarakinorhabdus sp. TaxID=1916663 RepID=UPI00286E6373